MRHTVEIADSAGKTMQISVYVENIGFGGSWRPITKGMIRHNSGSVVQYTGSFDPDVGVQLVAGGGGGGEPGGNNKVGEGGEEEEGGEGGPRWWRLIRGGGRWGVVC